MKKRILLGMIVVVFLLSGCSKSASITETECSGLLIKVSGFGPCTEWVDSETGVHYFCVNDVSLCPRYNADGSLMITEVER